VIHIDNYMCMKIQAPSDLSISPYVAQCWNNRNTVNWQMNIEKR